MRGAEALPLFRSVQQWQYRFTQGLITRKDSGLPNTDEVLQQLTDGQPLRATPTPSAQYIEWSQLRKIIEEETNYACGPVGTLLCAEYLAHAAPPLDRHQVEQLLVVIAGATGESKRAAVFQQKVCARLP